MRIVICGGELAAVVDRALGGALVAERPEDLEGYVGAAASGEPVALLVAWPADDQWLEAVLDVVDRVEGAVAIAVSRGAVSLADWREAAALGLGGLLPVNGLEEGRVKAAASATFEAAGRLAMARRRRKREAVAAAPAPAIAVHSDAGGELLPAMSPLIRSRAWQEPRLQQRTVGQGFRKVGLVVACLLAFAAGILVNLAVPPDARQPLQAVFRRQGASRAGIGVQSTVVHADPDGWAQVVVENRGRHPAEVHVVADRGERVTVTGEAVRLEPGQQRAVRFRVAEGGGKSAKVLVRMKEVPDHDLLSLVRREDRRTPVNVVLSVPVTVVMDTGG